MRESRKRALGLAMPEHEICTVAKRQPLLFPILHRTSPKTRRGRITLIAGKMKTRAKSIIGRLATWAYVVCAVLAVAFTISYFRSEGGPQVMGYALVFIFLFFCAVCAIGSIAATGAWKEKKMIVYVGALAWPLPIYLSALVVRAMFAS